MRNFVFILLFFIHGEPVSDTTKSDSVTIEQTTDQMQCDLDTIKIMMKELTAKVKNDTI